MKLPTKLRDRLHDLSCTVYVCLHVGLLYKRPGQEGLLQNNEPAVKEFSTLNHGKSIEIAVSSLSKFPLAAVIISVYAPTEGNLQKRLPREEGRRLKDKKSNFEYSNLHLHLSTVPFHTRK